MLFILIRSLFHLLPVWPLAYGRYYFVGAAILLVVLPYIKTFKLQAEITIEMEKPAPNQDYINRTKKAQSRWQTLTFLGKQVTL